MGQGQRLFERLEYSCRKVSDIYGGAAYPAFTQFASLSGQHRHNISEKSAQTRHISELLAEYQRTIRRTSEHQTNIRETSEQHQRIRSLARERQRHIGKLSVAQSAAYRQLRLSIRSGLCYQQIGDRRPTIPATQPSPRAGAARVRWLLACAATGLTPYTEAASTDYWRKPLTCSGCALERSNRRFQSIPVTCSGRAALGGSNGAATQQGYQGSGVTAGLHSEADVWRNPHRKPGHDPHRTCGLAKGRPLNHA